MSQQPSIDDLTFLRELIGLIDADPTSLKSGADVAEALGVASADIEPNIVRLRNRDLVERVPGGPSRLGSKPSQFPLRPTPAGYRHDDTGLNR